MITPLMVIRKVEQWSDGEKVGPESRLGSIG